MNITVKGAKKNIAVINDREPLITDVQSALDLATTVRYETGADKLVLMKECIDENFFILSTGLAGEILQKYMTYQTDLAVVGDFSHYNSKPLHDFIRESNRGKHFFFVSTEDEAVKKLT